MFDLELLPVGECTNRGDDWGEPGCPELEEVKKGKGASKTSSSSVLGADVGDPREETEDIVGLAIRPL
jgi:hypothetical protein